MGVYCLGCCWVLMALLFAGGVMSLLWIAALAVVDSCSAASHDIRAGFAGE